MTRGDRVIWNRKPRGGMRRREQLRVTVVDVLASGYAVVTYTRRWREIVRTVKVSNLEEIA